MAFDKSAFKAISGRARVAALLQSGNSTHLALTPDPSWAAALDES